MLRGAIGEQTALIQNASTNAASDLKDVLSPAVVAVSDPGMMENTCEWYDIL